MKVIARTAGPHNEDVCALSLDWMFRLVLPLGGHKVLLEESQFTDIEIARELGLGHFGLVDQDEFDLDGRQSTGSDQKGTFRVRSLTKLAAEWELLRLSFPTLGYPDRLGENLEEMSRHIGLDEMDRKILGFMVMMQTDGLLHETAEMLGFISNAKLPRVVSQLLDLPTSAARQKLSRGGILVRVGLLLPIDEARGYLNSMLDLPQRWLADALRYRKGPIMELFQDSFRIAPPAELVRTDYDHIELDVDIVLGSLGNALATGATGVNILVYGLPGTGKSEFSRMVAQALSVSLYEIACTDRDGDPINSYRRLCALRSAMTVLGEQKSLLVFDEIEDLFTRVSEHELKPVTFQKGWINRILEENPVPCFWLTNDVTVMDDAMIRRFDVVIRLNSPPKAKRERIIRACSEDCLDDAMVTRLSEHDRVTPAIMTRAMRVTQILRADNEVIDPNHVVSRLVDATIEAQGFRSTNDVLRLPLPDTYSVQFLNTDHDLAGLVDGLRRHPHARLCFYGPPGTGKTAAGQWIARELGLPLMVKQVSDIVSPYIGETERNLAKVFRQAREEQGVLLIDEVDSFLQERKNAQRGWEVTQVNEMLTQIENYPGLFVASTNLMDGLDEAALRRFDLKINFRFLTPEQVCELFDRHTQKLGLMSSSEGLRTCLRRLDYLTPGDFSAVLRRSRFSPVSNADELYHALLGECSFKLKRQSRPIGFVT